MRLIRDIAHFDVNGCVVTVGNFDGLHLGHQALIAQLKQKARSLNLPTCVIIFEPQPNEFFLKSKPVARLMRLREKLTALNRLGIDYVLCFSFNKTLAALPAEDFVKQFLVGLNVRYMLIGDDFRFGYKRQGNINLLTQLGKQFSFEVQIMAPFAFNKSRISSSWVRQALQAGDMELVKQLLGHYYCMSGRVAHGDKLGRKLGFPTANIHLNRRAVPVAGIFAVKVYGVDGEALLGVANVGNRPAVGGDKTLLEVYIFDFDRDIYRQHLVVEFIYKLRDEEYYETLELLKKQISLDVVAAKQFFEKRC